MEAAIEKITAVAQPPAVYDRPVERDDPLLLCLVIMSRIYGVPKSPTALAAGLPIPPNGITPELFVRAADRIGLSASMARRPFNAISALSLPCGVTAWGHGGDIDGYHSYVVKTVDGPAISMTLTQSPEASSPTTDPRADVLMAQYCPT